MSGEGLPTADKLTQPSEAGCLGRCRAGAAALLLQRCRRRAATRAVACSTPRPRAKAARTLPGGRVPQPTVRSGLWGGSGCVCCWQDGALCTMPSSGSGGGGPWNKGPPGGRPHAAARHSSDDTYILLVRWFAGGGAESKKGKAVRPLSCSRGRGFFLPVWMSSEAAPTSRACGISASGGGGSRAPGARRARCLVLYAYCTRYSTEDPQCQRAGWTQVEGYIGGEETSKGYSKTRISCRPPR